MRIISQNRTCSVNFCQIYLFQELCEISAGFPDGSTKTIGRYKTVERTEQIFAEIHKTVMEHHGSNELVYYMPKD